MRLGNLGFNRSKSGFSRPKNSFGFSGAKNSFSSEKVSRWGEVATETLKTAGDVYARVLEARAAAKAAKRGEYGEYGAASSGEYGGWPVSGEYGAPGMAPQTKTLLIFGAAGLGALLLLMPKKGR